jgi:hypothetical protein
VKELIVKKLLSFLTGAQLFLPSLTLVASQADIYPVHPVNPRSGLSTWMWLRRIGNLAC